MSFLGFGGGSTTESFPCTGATTTGTSGGAQFDPAVSTLSCTASTVAGGFSHDLAFDAGFRTSADTTGTTNFSASVTNLRMVVSNRTPAPVLSGLVATVGLADDQVTIEFGEPVGFALSDLTLSNLSAGNLQPSGTTAYTFDVEPTVDGAGSMSLAGNTVTDAGNTAATAVTTTAIASRPEVSFESIVSTGATNTYRFRYTIPGGDELMFNTAMALSSNFGFTITNGTFVRAEIEGTDGLVDTIITPTGGDIIISFATGLVIDRASGNLSAAGGPFDVGNGDMTPPNGTLSALPTTVGMGGAAMTLIFSEKVPRLVATDLTPPTASIAALTGALNGPQTALITLSEASTDFALGSLTLTNATAVLSGSGASYIAVLTPVTDGTVALSVGVGAFSDLAGDDNDVASNEVSSTADLTPPTPTLTYASYTRIDVFTATITFDEPVTGFVLAGVTPVFAELTSFQTVSASVYTVTVTVMSFDLLTPPGIEVRANFATDLSSNPTIAAPSATRWDRARAYDFRHCKSVCRACNGDRDH